MRRSVVLVLLVLALGVTAVALAGGDADPGGPPTREPARGERRAIPAPAPPSIARDVPLPGVVAHLRALERAARAGGGTRAAGTAGDRATVAYVSERLRAAGWRVRRQAFSFPFFDERRPPRLERLAPARRTVDEVKTLRNSAGGDVTGRLARPRAPLGCAPGDWSALPRGSVALVERGTCTFSRKVGLAARAGAVGVVVYDRPGDDDLVTGSLRGPSSVPAVLVTRDSGLALARSGGRLRLRVDAETGRRRTHNLIADRAGRRGGRTAMAGAHLDSVAEGPGINDDGSGVAVLLEVAEQLGTPGRRPARPVRLGFWGAEELGLIGSRRYVRGLDPGARRNILAYLNADMVGSGNGGRFFYGSGDPEVLGRARRAAAASLRADGVPLRTTSIGGGSDHAPFARAGVPVAGLYSGSSEDKDADERRVWGGRAGVAFDPCYHRRCDTLARVDRRTLDELADAVGATLAELAGAGRR